MPQQVTISNIRIEGFGSYAKPTSFNFDSYGLFCVSGSNGSGKSTLFSALYWCLYKETLKDWSNAALQSYEWLRDKDYKGTRVITQLQVNKTKYMIVRHLNYKGTTLGLKGENTFMIFSKQARLKEKWGQEHMVGDELYKQDQKAYVIRLLGIDGNTFINSVIFGQKMNRLIGAKPAEKRELFENLWQLDFIEVAKTKAQARAAEIEKEIQAHKHSIDKLSDVTEIDRERLTDKMVFTAEWEAAKKMRLSEIRKELNLSIDKYNTLLDRLGRRQRDQAAHQHDKSAERHTQVTDKEVDELWRKHEEANLTLTESRQIPPTIRRDMRDVENDIKAAERKVIQLQKELDEMEDKCPTCGTPHDPKKIKEMRLLIQKEIIKMQPVVKAHHTKMAFHKAELEKAEQIIQLNDDEATKITKEYNRVRTIQKSLLSDPYTSDIQQLETHIDIVDEGIGKIKERYRKEKATTPPQVDTTDLEEKIKEGERQIQKVFRAIEKLEAEMKKVMWWVKKGFGNGGIKSYVFSAMLQQLNEYVAEYSPFLGYGVRFWVDLSKDSKPFMTTIYRDGKEYDYNNLSGGQAQRVDIAMAFAMFDMICYTTGFNFIVFDESSESMDADGLEMMNSLVALKAETKAVYFVSHNPLFNPPGSQVIEITGGIKESTSINQSV